MRVLFTLRDAIGHFHPLVPLAQAARAAGHEAAFAMPPSFRSAVEGLGFRWMPAGIERGEETSRELALFEEEGNRLRGREKTLFIRRGFASQLGPRMAADLLRVCDTWRPDVVVRDTQDYGGCIAAEVLGIPHAAHEAVAFDASARANMAAPLAALRAAHGLPPDPEQFGPQPAHVRIERYIPHSLLLPRCQFVISHGGSNTVLAALSLGIPQVLVPIRADQPDNAERCAAAGVARVVLPADATAASIREAALAVLGDPRYRRSAERVRDEIAALPGPDAAVALLEGLARDRRPVVAPR